LVTITETGFSVGLARVKAKPYSGAVGSELGNQVKAFSLARAGRLGRVRSNYGSGNQVKAFFLSGLVLSFSLKPGWVSWVN
jgi:hypothetical protein